MTATARSQQAPPLKAFRLVAGGHVGPDYASEPVFSPMPTAADPLREVLRYPRKTFKARAANTAQEPGVTDIVYSPDDLSAKHNRSNSTKFVALGDAPANIRSVFEEAVASGELDRAQGGLPSREELARRRPFAGRLDPAQGVRSRESLEVEPPGPTSGASDVERNEQIKKDAQARAEERQRLAEEQAARTGDAGDVSPPDDDDLDGMTKAQLVDVAQQEGVEVSSHDTKDEILKTIKKGRRSRG